MDDTHWMARALDLARRGRCTVTPNPAVGCVIVRDGQVVGEGWHQHAGGPHAEVHALAQAGDQACGAQVYVSLEPCAHHGRTPPCADALIRARVGQVTVAVEDPNPQVAGRGLARLREAGIAVQVDVLGDAACALNAGFFKRMRTGRPFVRLKLGLSLDGRSALADGRSQWITGPDARSDVQQWRAQACAIVTGIGTVLADDPRLDVRLPGTTRQPLRVVLDTHLRCPADAALWNGAGPVWVAHAVGQELAPELLARGAVGLPMPGGPGGLDLGVLLDALGAHGCNEVLLEAGATLAGQAIAQGLVDELLLYLAPRLLGADGRPALDLRQLPSLDAHTLELLEVVRVGDDIRVRARPRGARELACSPE